MPPDSSIPLIQVASVQLSRTQHDLGLFEELDPSLYHVVDEIHAGGHFAEDACILGERSELSVVALTFSRCLVLQGVLPRGESSHMSRWPRPHQQRQLMQSTGVFTQRAYR
jgi:hypothetical protein